MFCLHAPFPSAPLSIAPDLPDSHGPCSRWKLVPAEFGQLQYSRPRESVCFRNTSLQSWLLLSGRANYCNPRHLFRNLNASVLGTGAVLLLAYKLYNIFHMRQLVRTSSCSASELSSGFPKSPTGKVPTCLSCDSWATIFLPAELACRWACVLQGTLIPFRAALWKAIAMLGHQQALSPVFLLSWSSSYFHEIYKGWMYRSVLKLWHPLFWTELILSNARHFISFYLLLIFKPKLLLL